MNAFYTKRDKQFTFLINIRRDRDMVVWGPKYRIQHKVGGGISLREPDTEALP